MYGASICTSVVRVKVKMIRETFFLLFILFLLISGLAEHIEMLIKNKNVTLSVVLICSSFVLLLGASLVWMVLYYIKRERLMYSKDNLTDEILSDVHTALAKIPVRCVKPEDLQETQEDEGGNDCVICIDSFNIQELVRILPCRHEYHKLCIDTWLLEHRTCPICNMDVLKHYGYEVEADDDEPINEFEEDEIDESSLITDLIFLFTGSILQDEADDDEQSSESEQEEIEESSSPNSGLNHQPETESFTHGDNLETANSPTEVAEPFESCPGECVAPVPAQNDPIPEKSE